MMIVSTQAIFMDLNARKINVLENSAKMTFARNLPTCAKIKIVKELNVYVIEIVKMRKFAI